MAEQGTHAVNVFIRELIVHDDRDRVGGGGEYDVTFVAAASPGSAAPDSRSGCRWADSVSSGNSYEVRLWTGAVTFPSGHSLAVVGIGEEHDALIADALRGGLALLGADHDWGVGRWWRTTNGPHFDFLFFVARIEGGAPASDIAEPFWSSDALDAPGPDRPTPNEYAVAAGAPITHD
jgi:hypothetical protein